MSREELIKSVSHLYELAQKKQFDKPKSEIDDLLRNVISSGYYPLLKQVFLIKELVCEQAGDKNGVLMMRLLKLSKKIHEENLIDINDMFIDYINSEQIETVMPNEYIPLSPIQINAFYQEKTALPGSSVHLQCFFNTNFPAPLKCDEVLCVFEYDNKEEKQVSLGSISLDKSLKVISEHQIPAAVTHEKLVAFIFKMKKCIIRIPYLNSNSIEIVADPSVCKVDMQIPKRCITGTRLPVPVTLTAIGQTLTHVHISFSIDNPSIPIEITGKYNGKSFENETDLDDIPEGKSTTIDLLIKTDAQLMRTITMTLRYGTPLSVVGDFHKSLLFDFQYPFSMDIRFFDTEMRPILTNLALSPDDTILMSATMTNDMETPAEIISINGALDSYEAEDLPVKIAPGESYSFFGRIKKSGQFETTVSYNTSELGESRFTFKTPKVVENPRMSHFDIAAPHEAIMNQPFKVLIRITRPNKLIPIAQEGCPIVLQVEQSSKFFMCGPVSQNIYVFRGMKKDIAFTFVPLEAGATLLPTITLMDTSLPNPKPKQFSLPIVVLYHK